MPPPTPPDRAPRADSATNDPESRSSRDRTADSHVADADRPVSAAVLEAVAAATGTDLVDLSPLAEVVDPEALDALFGPKVDGRPRSSGRVEFTFRGHRVTVYSEGRVAVRRAGDASGTAEQ